MSLVVKMNIFLVVVILFVATATAFGNDQREESNVAIHEFKHLVPLKAVAEEIRPLNLVRSRRGLRVSPECLNASVQVLRNCPFDLTEIAKLYTGGAINPRIIRNLYNILCDNDACYCGIVASLKFCGNFQVKYKYLHAHRSQFSMRCATPCTKQWTSSLLYISKYVHIIPQFTIIL